MRSPSHPLHLVLGLAIWAAWFVMVYGGLSVACSLAPPARASGPFTWINGVLLLLTLAVVLLLLFLGWRCWRWKPACQDRDRDPEFISRVATLLYILTAAATLMIGLPVAVLPPCL